MKKLGFIRNIVVSVIALGILIITIVNTKEPKIILFFFNLSLIAVAFTVENICHIINKEEYTSLFAKAYKILALLLFTFILIDWSYFYIKEQESFQLILTIPFWLALGMYCKKLIKPHSFNNEESENYSLIMLVASSIVLAVLFAGFFCLISGLQGQAQENRTTEGYINVIGHYQGYEVYDRFKKTYKLIYEYKVDNKKYTVKTKGGIVEIPKKNSPIKLKFNPNNPSQAIIITSRNKTLIYVGTLFILGGFFFVILSLSMRNYFITWSINVVELYLGFLFFICGIGIITYQVGIYTPIEALKNMGISAIVPIIFGVMGSALMIKSLLKETK